MLVVPEYADAATKHRIKMATETTATYGDVWVEDLFPPDSAIMVVLRVTGDEPEIWHDVVLAASDGRRWRVVGGSMMAGWRSHAAGLRIVEVCPIEHKTVPDKGMRLRVERATDS